MATPRRLITGVKARIHLNQRTPLTEQHFPKKGTPPRAAHWTTYAKGDAARHVIGRMNKTEAAYAQQLDRLKAAGEVAWWRFEAISFSIGNDARYRPDFMVMLPDGLIHIVEVKGFWAEAAKVRIKVAASLYPFHFIAVTKRSKRDGGGWKEEEF